MPLCPVCNQLLVQVEEAEVAAHSCPTCHGTWINAAALTRRTRLETDPNQPHMTLPSLPELADTVTHSNSTKPLTCPDCRQVMIKERFLTQIPVQIDRCESCSHIWLDAGEQGLLIRLYCEFITTQKEKHPVQQQTLDRALQFQSTSESNTTTYSSGLDGTQIAMNIGSVILQILLDLLLSSASRRRW